MPWGFGPLAGITGVDILIDEVSHLGPDVVPGKEFMSPLLPEVSSLRGIMVSFP